MPTLSESYEIGFQKGIEALLPKIAEAVSMQSDLPFDISMKVAEAFIVDGLNAIRSPIDVEEKLAYYQQNHYPQYQQYQQRLPQRPQENNFAGAPPKTSLTGTATGIGGAGAIGYGLYKNHQAQGVSNKLFNYMKGNIQAGMSPEALKAPGAMSTLNKDAARQVGEFISGQNANYAKTYAGVAADPAISAGKRIAETEARMLQQVGGKGTELGKNVGRYLKSNALKSTALKSGLLGVGLLGVSQLF